MLYFYIYSYIFIFGLVIGCFLTVCISRIPEGQSIISPPSHCTNCGTRLRPLDLVPVFSYIFLRGRCRYCGNNVSAKYPMVELLTAVLFVVLFLKYSFTIDFFASAFISCILICVIFIDYQYKIIPNGLVITGIIGGIALVIYNVFQPVAIYGDGNIFNPLIGVLIGSGSLLLISIIGGIIFKTSDAMGMGDIKLLAPIGLFLGWKLTIVCLLSAIILAGIACIILMVLKKIDNKSTFAFGPFIAAGAFIALLFGWSILEFYLSFY